MLLFQIKLPCSQVLPVYPGRQWQKKFCRSTEAIQFPLDKQGMEAHGSTQGKLYRLYGITF